MLCGDDKKSGIIRLKNIFRNTLLHKVYSTNIKHSITPLCSDSGRAREQEEYWKGARGRTREQEESWSAVWGRALLQKGQDG
jgi:hypothetical protein